MTAFPRDALLERVNVRVGQPLNTDRPNDDLEQLQSQYRRAGCLYSGGGHPWAILDPVT